MNKFIYLFAFALLGIFTFACSSGSGVRNTNQANTANQNSTDSHAGHNMNSGNMELPAKEADFKIELTSTPAQIESGREAEMIFTVRDKSGNQIKDFKTVPEKKMHLIVVSDDLSEFEHLHPELQPDGRFIVKHNFKHGGKFLLYPDATPATGSQVVERIELNVGGNPKQRESLAADLSLRKSADGLAVEMKPEGTLSTGKTMNINFTVTDEQSGKPVKDLQNYLGELAHVVIISEDTQDFLHVHPMNAKKPDETTILAHTNFPRPGIYKVWTQFQRGGKIITVPFVINVVAGAGDTETAAKPSNGEIKINVSGEGFTPSVVEVKQDQPVKLIFYRADANNCGSEVIFSKLDLKKELPVGQEVAIEINPKETGEIAFNCGMNMMKGKIIVQ